MVTNIFDITPPKTSDITIIGIPYDGATSDKPGARFGPRAILHESNYQEMYSSYQNTSLDDKEQKTFNYTEITANLNINDMMEEITYFYNSLKTIPVTLGGDHSVTYPVIRSLVNKHPNMKILHLDAHTDLRGEYEGSIYSHASVMMNIANLIGPTNIIQYGIRSGTKEEFKYADDNNMIKSLEQVIEFLRNNNDPLYITLDLDVFDNLTGTGTAVPGGITFHEFIKIIKNIKGDNLIGFDIVELAPNLDPSGYSTTVATLCLKELLLKLRK